MRKELRSVIYDTVFITGCDENCEWQLPWFLENYFKHNDTPLAFMDFGITAEAADLLSEYGVEIISFTSQNKGWFKKPRAEFVLKEVFYISLYFSWLLFIF